MIGDTKEGVVSSYNPSQEVKELTMACQADYAVGHEILTREWTELNNRSVLSDMDNGRMMFNAFVDEYTDDPGQAWRWRGTRSKARNKGIGMHASLTMSYMIPTFTAQNSESEVDRDMSDFMRDIIEWMTLDQNSNYLSSFLDLVFAMESDPVVYLGAEFAQVMQMIKVRQEDGSYTKKEILDEVLSGFKAPIWTADQVLISNAFNRDIQTHRRIIKRRFIEYGEAEAKYGKHSSWGAVHPGFKTVFNVDEGLFYDIKDDEHPHLVEECFVEGRRDDVQIPFVGGIYVGDGNIEANPMKHRDNFGAPRYNIQQFGFHPIGSHFFYYKSMMNTLRWDNELYDAMSEIVMNRAILEVDFPVVVSGAQKFDEDIVFPNSVTTLEDKDAKVTSLLPNSNIAAGFSALRDTAESMDEGSINPTQMGQLPEASQKAYTVAQTQANARKMITAVAKSLALSISKYGLLMKDIAINNLTVAEVDNVVGSPLKYKSFLLPNKNVGGRNISKVLMFSDSLLGTDMSEQAEEQENLKLLEQVDYPNNKTHIYVANPELFAKYKYLATADYEEIFQNGSEQVRQTYEKLWTILNADPMIEREALLRGLLYSELRGKGDSLVAKKPMQGMQGLPAEMPQATNSQTPSLSTGNGRAPTVLS